MIIEKRLKSATKLGRSECYMFLNLRYLMVFLMFIIIKIANDFINNYLRESALSDSDQQTEVQKNWGPFPWAHRFYLVSLLHSLLETF